MEISQVKVRRTLAMLMIIFLVGSFAGGCATNNGVNDEDSTSYGNYGTRYGGWNH